MAYLNNSVYWIGADGNVWLKGPGGAVQNMGTPISTYSDPAHSGFDAKNGSAVATLINDPNAPRTTAPANPNNTAAPAAAPTPAPVDKSNDIALQNSGLSSVDQQTNSGLAGVDKALGGITGQYDAESSANEQNYTTQANTNQNNLQKNKQSALVNAAQGRQGLFGSLSSIGALNGDGINLANHAVQKGANEDLSGAEDTYGENQTTLDTSIGKFREEDKRRRQEATTAAEDAKTGIRHQAAKDKQGYYSNISNDYAAEGKADEAKKYSDMAGSLFGELANTSVPSTSLAYSGAAYTPSTLSDYIAGQGSTQVAATPVQGGGTGAAMPGLYASTSAKKKQQG